MRWNPYFNALMAAGYIWFIVLLLKFLNYTNGNKPDSLIDPIGGLSLLVFSAALMAFLFFYRPVVLLVANKKEEALKYFVKMISSFGIITLLVFTVIVLIK